MLSHQQDINNQTEALIQLPPKKRLDFIINHEAPLQVVRSMASSDLLLTIRELGAESSLELVELMHPKQVQELFDLELWPNDQLHIKAAGHYFSLLFDANRDTAIAQLYGLDIEFIGLMFKMVATIYDTTLGEEPIDFPDLYSTSPDGRFIICFDDKADFQGLSHSLHVFLEELYGRDLPFVLRLLESVRFELASGLEEECLRWRQNRLLDKGILPREERLEFFAPLSSAEIKRIFSQRPVMNFTAPENPLPVRVLVRQIDDKYPYLKAALAAFLYETKETFWQGFIHAGINMHASLSGDFGDREEMAKGYDYVKFLAELGLFQACAGHIDTAAETLKRSSPKYFIRLGRTTLTGLRRRLLSKTMDASHLFGPDFCYADSPLREVARAICLSEPRYYEGLLEQQRLTVRFFSTPSEVYATVRAVNELIFRAALMGSAGLGCTEESLAKRSALSHAGIFARSISNGYLGIAEPLADIGGERARKLFDKDQKLVADFKDFARGHGERLAAKLALASGQDLQPMLEKTANFTTAVLIQLEQNWQLLMG